MAKQKEKKEKNEKKEQTAIERHREKILQEKKRKMQQLECECCGKKSKHTCECQ